VEKKERLFSISEHADRYEPEPHGQIQGTIRSGGVAELAEGGGLEKQNRRFAI